MKSCHFSTNLFLFPLLGVKKVNVSDEEGEKNTHRSDFVGMSHPPNSNSNGNKHVKPRLTHKLYTSVPKVRSKGLDHKKNMDLTNDKAADVNHYEVQRSDKKDCVSHQNGVVTCGLILNGYCCKDNDGSGSEGGYTTPKKRRARCNNAKNTDGSMSEKDRDMQQGDATQEPGACHSGATSRLDVFRVAHKVDGQSAARRAAASEASTGEPPRKSSDGKAVSKKTEERHKSKLSSPSKEDSWTLCKPPPVFPVDNSSAKIDSKISYASKVKENLNKVAQGGGEALPPPVRPSQVPMSAMKTKTSASFTNGPGHGTFFATAASCIPPAPSIPSGENVACPLESNRSSTTSPVVGDAYEPRKCALLIYPLNMQPMLPSARHPDPPTAQTNQKALGDIFHNQWGLSFINEPSLGPEGVSSARVPAEDAGAVGTQSGRPAAQPCFDVDPSFLEPGALAQDPERRTCAPCSVSDICSTACVISEEEEEEELQLCGQEETQVEAKRAGCAVAELVPDIGAKCARGQATSVSFGSTKEPVHSKDAGRTCSWGSFDMKAAVTYHTKGNFNRLLLWICCV